ncbi:MAG TPA: efflux RND transporter periplasmic adaptor subunit [Bryobacteraceae bacterium]|nr:efflux RND transporter periplasmic adaptor subunit [Bryobacteraceae bacterium]
MTIERTWREAPLATRRRAALAALAILAAALSGCGKKEKGGEAEAEAPTPVQVSEARRGPIDHIVAADAVIYPINQANVTPKISAPVKRVLVNRGDHVKANQLVAELESRDLSASANESKSLFDQAQANYQNTSGATVVDDRTKAQDDVTAAAQAVEAAKKVYDNRVELVKQGALAQKLADDAKLTLVQAQSAYDTAERHLQTLTQVGQREQVAAAKAQAEAAKAHYETASVQLSYAEIRSPISGVVADRPVYPGEMATSGTPLISIVDISQIVARANIPVKDAQVIQVGRPATIAGPDGDIAGKVTVVSPAVDPQTTTVEVWVQAPNLGEKLKPGATAHVTIKAETLQDVIIVPASALLNSDEGGQKVMVAGSDNLAHERKIAVGIRQGDNLQLISGVQEGEKVIVSGGLGLDDKAKIKITAAPAEEESDEDEDK